MLAKNNTPLKPLSILPIFARACTKKINHFWRNPRAHAARITIFCVCRQSTHFQFFHRNHRQRVVELWYVSITKNQRNDDLAHTTRRRASRSYVRTFVELCTTQPTDTRKNSARLVIRVSARVSCASGVPMQSRPSASASSASMRSNHVFSVSLTLAHRSATARAARTQTTHVSVRNTHTHMGDSMRLDCGPTQAAVWISRVFLRII